MYPCKAMGGGNFGQTYGPWGREFAKLVDRFEGTIIAQGCNSIHIIKIVKNFVEDRTTWPKAGERSLSQDTAQWSSSGGSAPRATVEN